MAPTHTVAETLPQQLFPVFLVNFLTHNQTPPPRSPFYFIPAWTSPVPRFKLQPLFAKFILNGYTPPKPSPSPSPSYCYCKYLLNKLLPTSVIVRGHWVLYICMPQTTHQGLCTRHM